VTRVGQKLSASKEALMQQTLDPKPFQRGLFQPTIQTPTLATMPPEVKQKTIELMSRLLRQHWERQCVNQVKEDGHE
jgi:hypothetical protein